MMTWLASIAETSGHPTGGITLASIDAFATIGEAITKAMPIYTRGARLVKNRKNGYHLAIGTMQQRFGPSAIRQFRALVGYQNWISFDMGASIHAGQVVATPPENLTDPSALAGFFLVHGIVGNENQESILKLAVSEPEYRIGVAVAVRSLNNERKGAVQKIIESALGI
jgi:hypothetical protein